MVISAPKDSRELKNLLELAVEYNDGPFAIRYPRGESVDMGEEFEDKEIQVGSWQVLIEGKDIAILSVGGCLSISLSAQKILKNSDIDAEVVNARFVKPMDMTYLKQLKRFKVVITVEENAEIGGFGEQIAKYIAQKNLQVKFKAIALPDKFIEQGDQTTLRNLVGLSAENISNNIKDLLNK